MTTIAMLAAVSYLLAFLGHVFPWKIISFLTFDPKDITIVFTGYIFGPVAAIVVSVIVSFVEMVTFSSTGYWGFLMNVLSSCAFACTACIVYRKKRTIGFALISLICGVLAMVAVMLPWNYFITPIYMGVDRSVVAGMLIPTFLPFNLIKGSINAAVAFFIYKPLKKALKAARLIDM